MQMEGGKLIGQGTYGCVFNPPLLCKKKHLPKGQIGKITEAEDIEREIHAYKMLHKIKDTKYYFILADESCVPKSSKEQEEKDIEKCDFLERAHKGQIKQLFMSYGGTDLSKMNLLEKPLFFFTLIKHLLEMGSLMLLHGFVHYDIHAKNVVVDKMYVPRLIDFGQSFSKNEISLETINERWKVLSPEYSAEPPEVTFLTAIDDTNHYSFEEALFELMPKKRVLYLIEKLLGVPIRKQIINMGLFFKSSSAYQQKDLVKLWKLYYPGFDSWAIGVLLLEYLNKLIFIYEFIESSEWKLKKNIVINILKKMLATNPKDRIDCVEALSMFDPVNEIYTTYGVEWVNVRRKQRRKTT